MAKQKNETLAILVPVSSVIWFKEMNKARATGNYGTADQLKTLRGYLAASGWRQSGDGTIEVEKLPDNLKDRAAKERHDRWEFLKLQAKQDVEKLIDLAVFEELYVENGKLRPVEYLGVSGNRRSTVFFDAMVDRRRAGEPLTTVLPVQVCVFESDLERLETQTGENEFKTAGFIEMSTLDKLQAAKEMVELGAIQNDIRKAFKDGTGQKLWGILQLNKRFPDLNLIERMGRDPKDPSWINIGAVKNDLSSLITRTDPEELEEKNRKIRDKMKIQGKSDAAIEVELFQPAGRDDVEAYFMGRKEEGNAEKIMKKDTIKGLSENFPARPLAKMAKAVYDNNVDVVKAYRVAAEGFNAIDSLLADNDYPPVETLLVGITKVTGEARQELLKKLLALIV